LFAAVSQRDLEGIVAKRRGDAYGLETRWLKVKCIGYSQMDGRWELFAKRSADVSSAR
jgi:ATP-dependent DNA ligase